MEWDKRLLQAKHSEVLALNLSLQGKIDQLMSIQQASGASQAELGGQRLCPTVLQLFVKAIGYSRGMIMLVDERARVLRFKEGVVARRTCKCSTELLHLNDDPGVGDHDALDGVLEDPSQQAHLLLETAQLGDVLHRPHQLHHPALLVPLHLGQFVHYPLRPAGEQDAVLQADLAHLGGGADLVAHELAVVVVDLEQKVVDRYR